MQNNYDPKELGVSNFWWDNSEFFWMEITDRDQSEEISQIRGYIGENVWAPTHDTSGEKRIPSYSLVALVKPGDIVFHYSKTKNGIVGFSKVKTYAYDDIGYWGTQGVYSNKTDNHFKRPLFKADLHDFIEYENTLTLDEIRTNEDEIFKVINKLKEEKGSIYPPFVIKNNQVEPPQSYFTKMPKDVLSVLGLIDDDTFIEPTSDFVIKDIKNKRKGKPRKVNSKRKKIIEMYGMKIATEYLQSQGWKVDDTSTGTFDLTCYKDEKTLLVEVKGIQAEFGKVNLTKNEVIGHRANNNSNALIIVSEIKLDNNDVASGGVRFVRYNWYPNDEDLVPTQYTYYVNEEDFTAEPL